MVRQTSLEAFWSLGKPTIGRAQKAVLEALEEVSPASNKQVASHLKWPVNSVTPRMLELRQKHLVSQAYIARELNGRKAIYWQPKSESL